ERGAGSGGLGSQRREPAHQDRPRGRDRFGRGAGRRPGMSRARIIGIGAYAPKRILTNHELEKMVENSDEGVGQGPGHRERHIVDEGEGPSDLAIRAAQQAMERAQVTPEEIDFIVVGTTAGDMNFPTTANLVQHRLGCRNAGSVDVYAACSGSVYSLSIG